jgi:conjugative transfer region protein TrbK
MDVRTTAIVAALGFAGVALIGTVIDWNRPDEQPVVRRFQGQAVVPDNAPFRASLRRCREMGEAATSDPVCIRLWAENRSRFLTPRQPEPQPPRSAAQSDDAQQSVSNPAPSRPEAR